MQSVNVTHPARVGKPLEVHVSLGLRGEPSVVASGMIYVRGQGAMCDTKYRSKGDYPFGDAMFRDLRAGKIQQVTVRVPADRFVAGTWDVYATVSASNVLDESNNTSASSTVPIGW